MNLSLTKTLLSFPANCFVIAALLLYLSGCGSGVGDALGKETVAPQAVRNAMNINTAEKAELERLPGIGSKTAERILDHRHRFGKFRRAEHLMLVEGISDKRFRKLRRLIKVSQ